MAARALEVDTELSMEELERLYLDAPTPFEQRRAHVILLRAEGMAPSRVAQITRFHPQTISACVRDFNERGPDSLRDARRERNGRAPLLDEDALARLEADLQLPPPDGGRWSGPKVTRWLERHLGRAPNSMDDSMGWKTLKSLGYSYKSSRPRSVRSASDGEREAWKKN